MSGALWGLTGDIGTINDSGLLKIVDRKRNIFKLEHGEDCDQYHSAFTEGWT